MSLRRIRCEVEAMPLTRPYTIAFQSVSEVELLFLEIEDDAGRIGRGAATPEAAITGETFARCRDCLDPDALAWLVGQDVTALPRLLRELDLRCHDAPAARAAVDMALHDLLGQRLGVPVVELLGRAHEALPTSITIGIKDTLKETLEEADEYLGRGFSVLKVKLGLGPEDDLERLRALRAHVGPERVLRVDPNQAYDTAALIHFADRSTALGLEFLEQPLPARAIDELRGLPHALRQRIAADESLLDEGDALTLLRPQTACGIFNIKLMKCGGIRPALRIATLAETAGVSLMWGCMDESRIGISAALHAAFASPATRYLDLDGSLDLARDRVAGGFALDQGVMRTLDAPGLGLIGVS